MKKITMSIIMLFSLSTVIIGCRDTKTTEEKEEDGMEDVTDDVEDGAERAAEEVEGAYEDVKEEVDGETDDSQ